MHWIKGIIVITIFPWNQFHEKFRENEYLSKVQRHFTRHKYSKILDDMKIPDQLKRNLSQRYI